MVFIHGKGTLYMLSGPLPDFPWTRPNITSTKIQRTRKTDIVLVQIRRVEVVPGALRRNAGFVLLRKNREKTGN